MIEARVKGVGIHEKTNSSVVVLMPADSQDLQLVIWIGEFEAWAIARELSNLKPPRPQTHDLLANIVRELDGRVSRVEITALRGDAYLAELFVQQDGRVLKIDARPSDCIVLALKCKLPIFVYEGLFTAIQNPQAQPPTPELEQKPPVQILSSHELKQRIGQVPPEHFGEYRMDR